MNDRWSDVADDNLADDDDDDDLLEEGEFSFFENLGSDMGSLTESNEDNTSTSAGGNGGTNHDTEGPSCQHCDNRAEV